MNDPPAVRIGVASSRVTESSLALFRTDPPGALRGPLRGASWGTQIRIELLLYAGCPIPAPGGPPEGQCTKKTVCKTSVTNHAVKRMKKRDPEEEAEGTAEGTGDVARTSILGVFALQGASSKSISMGVRASYKI